LSKALRFREKTPGNAVRAFSVAWKNAKAKALHTELVIWRQFVISLESCLRRVHFTLL